VNFLSEIEVKYATTPKYRARLEGVVVQRSHYRICLDIDTIVETVFGNQQGAKKGHNPRNWGKICRTVLLLAAFFIGTDGGLRTSAVDLILLENFASMHR